MRRLSPLERLLDALDERGGGKVFGLERTNEHRHAQPQDGGRKDECWRRTAQERLGKRVHAILRAHWGFGKAAGVMISDDTGTVIGAEQGAFGHGLEPEDVEPLTVTTSDAIGVRQEGCGDAVMHALVVQGDSVTRIQPGRVGKVSLGGATYRFWNAANYNWINIKCTDMLDRTSWLFWRS